MGMKWKFENYSSWSWSQAEIDRIFRTAANGLMQPIASEIIENCIIFLFQIKQKQSSLLSEKWIFNDIDSNK